MVNMACDEYAHGLCDELMPLVSCAWCVTGVA